MHRMKREQKGGAKSESRIPGQGTNQKIHGDHACGTDGQVEDMEGQRMKSKRVIFQHVEDHPQRAVVVAGARVEKGPRIGAEQPGDVAVTGDKWILKQLHGVVGYESIAQRGGI